LGRIIYQIYTYNICRSALELREQIKNRYVPSLQNVEIDGDIIQPPQPLEWYPDDLGWHFKVSRGVLRKSPDINAFHKFIVAETEIVSERCIYEAVRHALS